MSNILKPENGNPSEYRLPQFPKNWGPYLAYNAAITLAAFGAASMAHSDVAAIVIGCTAICAVLAGLIVRLRRVD
jgi:hypothetical protein